MFDFAALTTSECGDQRVDFGLAHFLGKLKTHEKLSPLHLSGRDIHWASPPEPAASLRAAGFKHALRGPGLAGYETLLGFLEVCWEQGPGIPVGSRGKSEGGSCYYCWGETPYSVLPDLSLQQFKS